MALKDWVRNDGYIESTPSPTPVYKSDEQFIMLVRNIQYQDIQTGAFYKFPTLYDVALANEGRNYIPVTDNTKIIQDFSTTQVDSRNNIQDPPVQGLINYYRRNQI
jgi:hypothetical protein